LYNRGVELAEQGNATGDRCVQQTIKIYPKFENAHNNLGLALSKNKFEAATAFKRALAINPKNFETYNN